MATQDFSTVPPTPNAPPAPPVSQLGAGGRPTVAPSTSPAGVVQPSASTSSQTPSKTVLMVGPDGSHEYVSYDKVAANLAQGAELGVHMTGPDGSKAVVPFSKKDANQQNGATWDVSPDNNALKDYATGGLIKEKYGLPASADLTKPFHDPANAAVKDPLAFSQAYEEFNPPAHTTTKQKVWNFLSNQVKPYEGALAPRNPEEMLSPVEMMGADVAGAFAEPAVSAAAGAAKNLRFNPFRAAANAAKQVVQGEGIAQPAAQSALKTGAEAVLGKPSADGSLRTALDAPADSIFSQAKSLYKQVDDAAGTNFKDLAERLENTEYQIRQLTDSEEDAAKEASLEKARTATMDKIEAAKQQAINNNVDPAQLEKADTLFKQSQALRDLQTKVFQNPSIVRGNANMGTPETVNVDSAIKALQKLQDNTRFGQSRLEQAIGKDAANGMLKDLYAAQRAGQSALAFQNLAKWMVKGLGIAGAIGFGGHVYHAATE